MNIEYSFIVIDDSELDGFVIQKVIQHTYKNVSIKTFHNGLGAIEMIREHTGNDRVPAIIFLDLQMPVMDGNKFIEEFEKLPAEIQNNYVIVILSILSSSRYPVDIFRIGNYASVNCVMEKPLTKEKLIKLIEHLKPGN
jgi:CheY-like chemotaxis protein